MTQPVQLSCLVVLVVTVAMQLGHCKSCGKRPSGMTCETTICGAEKKSVKMCCVILALECSISKIWKEVISIRSYRR